MKNLKGYIIVLLLSSSIISSAQVSNFTLLNAVDNQQVSLDSYSSKKAVVIIFTSNYCPYSKLYEQRIQDLYQEFKEKGVQILLINPNNPSSSKSESIEEMHSKAKSSGFGFPYLADKDQTVCSSFNATKTPHAFVLIPKGGQFQIVYNGAIDDNPQVDSDVSRQYLKEALESVLNGRKPATAKTSPTGCIIKRG